MKYHRIPINLQILPWWWLVELISGVLVSSFEVSSFHAYLLNFVGESNRRSPFPVAASTYTHISFNRKDTPLCFIMSEWDDLFSSMEALPKPSPPPPTTQGSDSSQTSRKKTKKRKRKNPPPSSSTTNSSLSSLSQTISLSSDFSFGGLLKGGSDCRAFVSGKVSGKDEMECSACSKPRAHHRLVSNSTIPASQLFCNVRNIRLVAADKIRSVGTAELCEWCSAAFSFLGQSKIHPAEKEIILSKIQALKNAIAGGGEKTVKQFENRAKVICCADAVYFRLYYIVRDVIPAPPSYFALLSSSQHHPISRRLLTLSKTNPLLCLRELRRVETDRLFGKFGRDESRIAEHLSAVASAEEENAVACAPLLSAWRDSIRDFPCNIYSYATLNDANLDSVKKICEKYDLSVLEMGAGTGYVSALLELHGVKIHAAYDIALSNNAYHGTVRPYRQVLQGNETKLYEVKALEKKCLLLCYPPPDNEMGRDALSIFIKRGGRFIIHVGEFKGLTGTPAFERKLQDRFVCLQSSHCELWGNDSTSLTFWRLKTGDDHDTTDFQFPRCNVCGRTGTKRCHFNSSIVYCDNESCFLDDREERNSTLAVNNIAVLGHQMDSSNKNFRQI